MYKRLFIPGPVDVLPDNLEAMATPMIAHRSKEASALQKGIADKLRTLMFTDSTILLSTSSGSGLMEGAIRSCTRKRAAVFSVGAFGDRWYEMALANNLPADRFEAEPGRKTSPESVRSALETGLYDVVTVTHNETSSGIVNPCAEIGAVIRDFPGVLFLVDAVSSLGGDRIEVDAWGIDVCITSTQKCLGLPPGLSLCSVSERAIAAAREKEHRGFYLDLVKLYDQVKKNDQYPSTPSLSHMFALDRQLDRILDEEGLENRFARHARLAEMVRTWAQRHFQLFADADCRSNTVTCIKNTGDYDIAALNRELGERGFLISNGYGKYKDKTFRIATMADVSEETLTELLRAITEIWHLED